MRGRPIFNEANKDLIRQLVAQNVPAAEIAERLGCTHSTLKVRCSHFQISLRTPNWKERRRATCEARYSAEELAERNALPKLAPIAQAKLEVPVKTRDTFKMESMLALSRVAMSLIRQQAELAGKSDAQLASELLEAIAKADLFETVLRRAA